MESNTRLEAARRLRGWSLEMASQKIGVHPRTLRRWETGKSRPHDFRIYKISEVYEMTPSALGIGSERHQWFIPSHTMLHGEEQVLLAGIVEPLMTIEDLDLHLMGLILERKLERKNLDYLTFQRQIHRCIQVYDQGLQKVHIAPSTDQVRVQALRIVAAIPGATFLENLLQHSQPARPVEILTHCAGAITACWHMDLKQDLSLVRHFVSGYIILLSELFTRSKYCRSATAELIAQACLLRTMLALQLEDTHVSVSYYTRALEFSQFADDTCASLHSHTLYGYGRQPAQTLQKMAESLWLLKPAPPQSDFPLVRDYLHKLLSFYPLPDPGEQANESLASSGRSAAPSFHFPGASNYIEAALNLWEFLTYYELGEYAQALDNLRTGRPEEPICDAPEQVRGEFLENRALAALRLHDMDQGITTLRAAIPQALSMGNEQELVEAHEAYHMMQFLIPGETLTSAQELKDLLKTHD